MQFWFITSLNGMLLFGAVRILNNANLTFWQINGYVTNFERKGEISNVKIIKNIDQKIKLNAYKGRHIYKNIKSVLNSNRIYPRRNQNYFLFVIIYYNYQYLFNVRNVPLLSIFFNYISNYISLFIFKMKNLSKITFY